MVDEQLLAGAVVLPQHDVEVAGPFAILLAEPTVLGAAGMLLGELLPEQLQGDAAVRLQFPVDLGEVGLGLGLLAGGGGRRCWWREQPFLSSTDSGNGQPSWAAVARSR